MARLVTHFAGVNEICEMRYDEMGTEPINTLKYPNTCLYSWAWRIC